MDANNYSILMDTKSFILMLKSSIYDQYTLKILKEILSSKFENFDVIIESDECFHILIRPKDVGLRIDSNIINNLYSKICNSFIEFFNNAIIESRIISYIEINKSNSLVNVNGIKTVLDKIIFDKDVDIIPLILSNTTLIDNMINIIL